MEEEDIDIAAAMGFASFGGTKKRKFDHASSPKAKVDSSGANATKLGVRTKKIASAGESAEDHTEEAEPNPPTSNANTSRNPSVAAGLAAFLARGQTLSDHAPGAQTPDGIHMENSLANTETLSFGGPTISRAELNALRNGVNNETGDTAYFLPNFVEDPWERLTKSSSV